MPLAIIGNEMGIWEQAQTVYTDKPRTIWDDAEVNYKAQLKTPTDWLNERTERGLMMQSMDWSPELLKSVKEDLATSINAAQTQNEKANVFNQWWSEFGQYIPMTSLQRMADENVPPGQLEIKQFDEALKLAQDMNLPLSVSTGNFQNIKNAKKMGISSDTIRDVLTGKKKITTDEIEQSFNGIMPLKDVVFIPKEKEEPVDLLKAAEAVISGESVPDRYATQRIVRLDYENPFGDLTGDERSLFRKFYDKLFPYTPYREEKPLRTAIGGGLRLTAAAATGMTLGLSDVFATKVVGRPVTLVNEVDKLTGYEATPRENATLEIAEFIGGLRTAYKLVGPLASRLPIRPILQRYASTILAGEVRGFSNQFKMKVISNKPIEPWEVQKETAGLVLMHTIGEGVSAVVSKIQISNFVKDMQKTYPWLRDVKPSTFEQMVKAQSELNQVKTIGQWKVWNKTWGQAVDRGLAEFDSAFKANFPQAKPPALLTGQTRGPLLTPTFSENGDIMRINQASEPPIKAPVSPQIQRTQPVTTSKTPKTTTEPVQAPEGGTGQIQAKELSTEEAQGLFREQISALNEIALSMGQIYSKYPADRKEQISAELLNDAIVAIRTMKSPGSKYGKQRTVSDIQSILDKVKQRTEKGFIAVEKKAGGRGAGPVQEKAPPRSHRIAHQIYMLASYIENSSVFKSLIEGATPILTSQRVLQPDLNKLPEGATIETAKFAAKEDTGGPFSMARPAEEFEIITMPTKPTPEQKSYLNEQGFRPYYKEPNRWYGPSREIIISEKAPEVQPKVTTEQQQALEEFLGPIEEPQQVSSVLPEETDEIIKNESNKPEYKNAGFADFEPVINAANKAHDWLFTFGEVKRNNPELFDKLMSSYGKRNAAVEKAIGILKKVAPDSITQEQATELAILYEDKRLASSDELRDLYKGYADLLDKIQEKSVNEGLISRPFNERMIDENNAKIEQLRGQLKHPEKSKRIAELIAENETLAQMRYLPHNIAARRVLELKLAELKGEERKSWLDKVSRISARFKKRTGRKFLKEYLDSGLLETTDVDIRKLSADALTDYYYRSAIKDLLDYSKQADLIKDASNELRQQGWLNAQEIGIISPELKEKVVHPLLASALGEMKDMRLRPNLATYRKVLGVTKIAQFIKPSIIWVYDIVQKYMKGMYSLNPLREGRNLYEAADVVLRQKGLYHKLNESNLFQFPKEVSRASREQAIKMYLRAQSEEINWAVKWLEKATGVSWSLEDIASVKGLLNHTLMVPYHVLANAAWTGDKIIRTQSYLTLRDMGFGHDEAVKQAAHAHGAYSALSKKYHDTASLAFFVHSFRLLMPIEIGKVFAEPITGAAKAYASKEKIPKNVWQRWAKALGATFAIPFLVDFYMKVRGFEKEGASLGPLAWKYKKSITYHDDDGKRQTQELVVGMNYILNLPMKYLTRLSYYNPIEPRARWQQALGNLIKWELHPLYRIFAWDIAENKQSFGNGPVYDVNASAPVQLAQTASYIFAQTFRIVGGSFEGGFYESNLTDKEKIQQEKIFDDSLSKLDKILIGTFGYKYLRMPKEQRAIILQRQLLDETRHRAYMIGRKYEGKERDNRIEDLKRWVKKCEAWIKEQSK